MLLAIDVGNSNIVIGAFRTRAVSGANKHKKSRDSFTYRLQTCPELDLSDWQTYLRQEFQKCRIKLGDVSAAVISSVVPRLNEPLRNILNTGLGIQNPYFVTHKSDCHLLIDVDKPEQVGTDRLVTAAAAFEKYKTDLIVIDLGTATTFDCILTTAQSPSRPVASYIGGIIAPGLQTSAWALFQRAAQLFEVPIVKPKTVVGRNTRACIQSGLYWAHLDMIDSLVRRIQKELGRKMTVVATGGLASLFVKESETIEYHEKDLILDGLRLVHAWNVHQ